MKNFPALFFAVLAVLLGPPSIRAANAPARAGDVSGTWDAVIETSQGSGTPVFTLRQDGQKLTGKYQGQFGEAPLTGTLKGNQVAFTFTLSGEDMKVEYSGTVNGDRMKGRARFGSENEGSFTAKRRAGK